MLSNVFGIESEKFLQIIHRDIELWRREHIVEDNDEFNNNKTREKKT